MRHKATNGTYYLDTLIRIVNSVCRYSKTVARNSAHVHISRHIRETLSSYYTLVIQITDVYKMFFLLETMLRYYRRLHLYMKLSG